MITILSIFKLAWYTNSDYQITLAINNVIIINLQYSIIDIDVVRAMFEDIEHKKIKWHVMSVTYQAVSLYYCKVY